MNNKRNSIIFAILCSIVVFIISFAVICPNVDRIKSEPVGDCVNIIDPSSASVLTAGTIDKNGNVTVDSENACVIEFKANGQAVSCFNLNLSKGLTKGATFMVESTVDGSFKDCENVYGNLFVGEDSLCITLGEGKYTAIRIWFETDCKIENIAFYEDMPSEKVVSVYIEVWRYILVLFITIFAFAAILFADIKLAVSNKLYVLIKKEYMRATAIIIGIGTAIILGIITELIFRAIYGVDSIGNRFNISSCTIFCAIFVCIFILFIERKNFAEKPEKAVFFIILSAGIFMILSQPFGHNAWDVNVHYAWALENSFFKTANYTDADTAIRYSTLFKPVNSLEASEAIKTQLNSIGELVTSQTQVDFSIAHVPAGIFIAVARLFGADLYTRYLLGQVPNIIIYAVVVYFALKKLKTGKMIMATIALLPTNILIASTYSYDYWVNAFSFLGVAYFISEAEQPDKPISIGETFIMCLAFALSALPKQIYVMLLAIPFFMRKNWQSKKAKKTYFLFLITTFIIVLILFIIRAYTSLTGTGDTRGGDVNPAEQVAYIFANPIEYTGTLIKFLAKYLSIGAEGLRGYTTFFAYLGAGDFASLYVILICFTVLTDKGENNRFKGSLLLQILSTLLLLGGSAVIASALFVAFTPVGHNGINGCQPRYVVPILMPFLLTITNPGIRIFKRKAVYNFLILFLLTALLIYNITTVVAIPMM